MLDDITHRLLSLHPGTFEPLQASNPVRPNFVPHNGFRLYVRPPVGLYQTTQPPVYSDAPNNKAKQAEVAIRKLYKSVTFGRSNLNCGENTSSFLHKATTEELLAKYHESSIYSKSRLRKVNRIYLGKALAAVRNNIKLSNTAEPAEGHKNRTPNYEEANRNSGVNTPIDEDSLEKRSDSKYNDIEKGEVTRKKTKFDPNHRHNRTTKHTTKISSPIRNRLETQINDMRKLSLAMPKFQNRPAEKNISKFNKNHDGVYKLELRPSKIIGNCTKIVTFKKKLHEYSFDNRRENFPKHPKIEKENAVNGIEHIYNVNSGREASVEEKHSQEQDGSNAPRQSSAPSSLKIRGPRNRSVSTNNEEMLRFFSMTETYSPSGESAQRKTDDSRGDAEKNRKQIPKKGRLYETASRRSVHSDRVCLELPKIVPTLDVSCRSQTRA